MDEEGIMALPQGAAMPSTQALPKITSLQAYDAAQTAMGMTDPNGLAALTESLRQNLAGIELSPSELKTMIELFEYLSQNPADYPSARQQLIADDVVDPEDLPEEYDPEFLGAMLMALNELQISQAQGAQAPMQEDPMAAMGGMTPMAMAEGGLADVASYLAAQGRNGDTMLAHITPEEAQLLRSRGGSGTINPATGLPEFFSLRKSLKKAFKSVGNAVKKVVSSPVGRLLVSMALATVLGPVGMALAQGGMTLAAGGDLKQALVAGAMGYIGAGGTVMGVSPVSAVGGFLPGAAGSALNTGLATGVIGAGIGKIGGMSTEDALKMGLTSGLTAAAGQAYRNANAPVGQAPAGQPPAGQAPAGQAPAGQPPAGQPAVDASVAADGTITPATINPAGTATDLLNANPPPNAQMQFAQNDPSQYYDIGAEIGISPDAAAAGAPTVAPASSNAAYDYDKLIGIEPSSTSSSPGQSPSNVQIERDMLGMTGPMDTARQYIVDPVKDAYNEYISPSNIEARGQLEAEQAGNKAMQDYDARHGTGGTAAGRENAYQTAFNNAMPGMLATYGPAVAAGTLGVAALGGFDSFFKEDQPDEEPLYEKDYTGSDYMEDNPQEFRGGLDMDYKAPDTPYGLENPVINKNFSLAPPPSAPVVRNNIAPVYMPTGITNSPGGIVQPYNMPGMYNVPMIYPVRAATGGEMTRTQYPRKTGHISGPGTGTSDDIPAMLSDGEFVFTAKAVRNAGKGSRRKGAARMYKLMKMLEGGPVKGK